MELVFIPTCLHCEPSVSLSCLVSIICVHMHSTKPYIFVLSIRDAIVVGPGTDL